MPTTLRTYEATPYASHMSIFLSDHASTDEVDYPAWHLADVAKRRVLAMPSELQIATARYDIVPVQLRIMSDAPEPDLHAEHVVEADLQIPSGRLVLHTAADDFEKVPDIAVAPGLHRVRVTYRSRQTPVPEANPDAPGDHFDYVIDVWPVSEAAQPEVLVQGAEIWAG